MTTKRKYFGTDGIRGTVGQGYITPQFVMKLGWAAGKVLSQNSSNGTILIGKDTRISGYMFEAALEAGIVSAGLNVNFLGPMPTPAVAYLTRTLRASAGIVISASHNPFQDNGIKFFSTDGFKLPDEIELQIEKALDNEMTTVSSEKLGKVARINDAKGRYIEFCKASIPTEISLRGMHIVVDSANGATYDVAPYVFEELGATVTNIGNKPNGLNINDNVGATSPERLAATVKELGADVGVALDGDGDRLIMCDQYGNIIDGDDCLYIIALDYLKRGKLKGGVVGTLMTNLGLELALADKGIEFCRAKVGDRYVLEELKARNWRVGGESSGHIICLNKTTTGDGIVAALQVLRVMSSEGRDLHDLLGDMEKTPQHMVNVRIQAGKKPLDSDEVWAAVKEVEAALGKSGRVLLRASGTEPLIRVMVESTDKNKVAEYAKQIAAVVESV